MANGKEGQTMLERHVQTILTALAVMLLGWVGMTLVDTKSSIVTLTTEVGFLKDQMNDMKSTLREEKIDNKSVLKEHDLRIKANELRVQELYNEMKRSSQ